MTETERAIERMPEEKRETRSRISRRRLLTTAGAGAAGVVVFAGGAVAGYDHRIPPKAAPPSRPDGWALTFISRPDLAPPRVQVTDVNAPATTEYSFITPNKGPSQRGSGQQGLMIVDRRGEVVWFKQLPGAFSNLRVQTYKGQPVLTWWQGQFESAGFGRGVSTIADNTYQPLATVKAHNGLMADMHEFELTTRGTALITAYGTATADLRSIGGSKSQKLYVGVAQEIDIATGNLVFEWRSLDHIGVDETHSEPTKGDTFDYFHINSIGVDPTDDNLIISARNTWTIYKVHRTSGEVLWRLGGKRSDFQMGPGTEFAWQHHARAFDGGVLTLFDDGASPPVEPQSRGLQLQIDTTTKTAKLTKAFAHPARLLADNQGSMQLLPDGGAIIGWGSEPYLSEFDSDGNLVRDGRMPTDEESYRAFRYRWVSDPGGVPDVKVVADDVDGYEAYISWNGATEVATWQILSGKQPNNLTDSGSIPKAGFETAVTVHPKGNYLAVQALDAKGNVLGTSKTVVIQGKVPD